MKIGKPIRKKVYGFILQDNEVGEKTLLVYLNEPEVPFRLVGGNVDAGETEEEALFREIQEESGLKQFKLVKKIGTQYYYKDFIDANVERHDYLLIPETRLPEKWSFTGEGEGEDCGTIFNY
jgi:ADP-ribose pyrophosphatase YjhB (NUDIX family)